MSTRTTTLRNTAFTSVAIYTEYFLGMLTSILIANSNAPTQIMLSKCLMSIDGDKPSYT